MQSTFKLDLLLAEQLMKFNPAYIPNAVSQAEADANGRDSFAINLDDQSTWIEVWRKDGAIERWSPTRNMADAQEVAEHIGISAHLLGNTPLAIATAAAATISDEERAAFKSVGVHY